MKTENLILLAVGGGLVLAMSKKKDSPATNAVVASTEAISAAAQSGGADAVKKEMKAQTNELMSTVLPGSSVRGIVRSFGVGQIAANPPMTKPIDLAMSANYGPFSPKNPPSPKQFAILYAVSPASAAAAMPAGTATSYIKAITADAGLFALAKETDPQKRIYNLLSLLSPNQQRVFAANCSFRTLPILELPPLNGTSARKLGSEIVSAAIARAEGKMTAEQLDAIAKPKIKALQDLAAKTKSPGSVLSVIRALEATALSAPSTYSVEARKAVQYSNMVMAMKLNRKAVVQFNQEVSSHGLPKNQAGKSAAQAAEEAAEKAGRKGAQEFDSEAVEKLLRKAIK